MGCHDISEHLMLIADKDRKEVHVQLDYHLCHTEHKSSTWRQALREHHFRAENIADLIEFIYFLWFEARQLCRAARMLAKVCCCHATIIPGVHQYVCPPVQQISCCGMGAASLWQSYCQS